MAGSRWLCHLSRIYACVCVCVRVCAISPASVPWQRKVKSAKQSATPRAANEPSKSRLSAALRIKAQHQRIIWLKDSYSRADSAERTGRALGLS